MTVKLQDTKVSKAVSLVLSLANERQTNDVLDDSVTLIQLQIGVKKIPKQQKRMKLKLPHPIATPDADVCLFVKDLDKNETDTDSTVFHFEDLLSKKGIKNVKEIIPVKALKTDYKPYESKWNLSNAYDIYLADERIVTCLPRLLGKNFYGRKRGPTQINMLANDLQKEISRAINTSQFSFSAKGSTSMAVVGHSGMSRDHLTANILAAVSQISTSIPGSANNVKQLAIKAKTSTSVPIYLAAGGPQDVKFRRKKTKAPKIEVDDLSTLTDGKVAVFPDGKVLVIKGGQTLKEVLQAERNTEISRKKKAQDILKRHSKPPAKKAKLMVKDAPKLRAKNKDAPKLKTNDKDALKHKVNKDAAKLKAKNKVAPKHKVNTKVNKDALTLKAKNKVNNDAPKLKAKNKVNKDILKLKAKNKVKKLKKVNDVKNGKK